MIRLVTDGLALNSRRTYSKAVEKYIDFCVVYSINPLILDETNILRFIYFLVVSGLAPATIRVYLSGLRAWLINQGARDVSLYTPRVKLAIRAAERRAPPPSRVKPITYALLSKVFYFLPYTLYHMVGFTAMLVGYFGCLRAAEYLPDRDSAPPILPADLEFVDASPAYGVLKIPSSKTAAKGFKVVIGCTGTQICALCWLDYLLRARQLPKGDPLFAISPGVVLSRSQFSRFIRESLLAASVDPTGYTPHSLRAGAATHAAGVGLPDSTIQALGRWRSPAYRAYIRPQDEQLAQLSSQLAAAHGPPAHNSTNFPY